MPMWVFFAAAACVPEASGSSEARVWANRIPVVTLSWGTVEKRRLPALCAADRVVVARAVAVQATVERVATLAIDAELQGPPLPPTVDVELADPVGHPGAPADRTLPVGERHVVSLATTDGSRPRVLWSHPAPLVVALPDAEVLRAEWSAVCPP
jgi:hypothetical protein